MSAPAQEVLGGSALSARLVVIIGGFFSRIFLFWGSNSPVELRRLLENLFAEPGLQGVSQIGGMSRRNSLEIPLWWLANSRWATHSLTKGDTNPEPNRTNERSHAFPHHHALFWPATKRREILSVIFSSGIAESDPKPVSVPMASVLFELPPRPHRRHHGPARLKNYGNFYSPFEGAAIAHLRKPMSALGQKRLSVFFPRKRHQMRHNRMAAKGQWRTPLAM